MSGQGRLQVVAVTLSSDTSSPRSDVEYNNDILSVSSRRRVVLTYLARRFYAQVTDTSIKLLISECMTKTEPLMKNAF